MARPMHLLVPALLLTSTALAVPAHAALPDAAKTMIINAAREGDAAELATAVKLARRSFPEDSAEIDALLIGLDSRGEGDAAAVATTPQLASVPEVTAKVETPSPAPVKWKGRGELGGFRSTGNSDSFGISAGGALTRKGESITHQFRLRGDYQENKGIKSREFANAAYQGDWKISAKHYALGLLGYEHDVLAGIEHRLTSSLGLGWKAAESKELNLSIEAGPALRYSWLTNGSEESNVAGRGAFTGAWQVNDKVRLSQNMEMVAQTTNSTFSSVTALQAKLTGRISSQFSYDLRHQEKPLAGRQKTDTVTRVGLVYDF